MNFNYRGIIVADISTWQDSPMIAGTVDFAKMRDFGFRAVCLRATNGITQDADFDTYRANATGVLPWFAYHYYNNLYDPKQQAQKFFDVLTPNLPSVCVLDLEDKQSGFRGWRRWYDFLVEFQRLSGLPNHRIWIYTNESYFGEVSGAITETQRNWFARYPLWLASYFADPQHPNYAFVNIPQPWTDIVMLQSGTPPFGLQAGVESREIDYNQFQGDEELFTSIFGGFSAPQTPGETSMSYEATALYNGTRLRDDHSTNNEYIGNYPRGTVFYGAEIWTCPGNIYSGANVLLQMQGDRWLKVDRVGSEQRVGWVAITHKGQAICSLDEVAAPPPPPAGGLPDVLWIGETRESVREYRKAA